MKMLQRSNFLIFFDDVRVDNYVVNWSVTNGLFANNASANITLFRSDAMDNWKAYLTQVKVFGENPFTKKFTLMFDGEIMNRSWNQSKSNMGMVTYQAKGYYHWLDIPVPLGVQTSDEMDPLLRFIYEAQNINIEEVRTLIQSKGDILLKDKNIEGIIEHLFEKLTIGYYDVAGSDTAFAFAKVKDRFKVMVDVMDEFRESGFLDLFTFSQATQIDSFYVYLNEVLSQLMFEFFQDRDGSFRIKTPSWSEPVLKAHVLDSSIVTGVSGLDDWENEPTRVLAIGVESQLLSSQSPGSGDQGGLGKLTIPIGLYVGNPQDPTTEEYYSQQLEHTRTIYGSNPNDYGSGDPTGSISTGQWFDNTGSYKINSRHRTENSGRPTHKGVDFNFKNEPVYSIGTFGTVVAGGWHDSMGNYVMIRQNISGTIYDFRYMHFSSPATVEMGQEVAPGKRLGTSGNTGDSSGPHLHFEIWKGGLSARTDINPIPFLAAARGNLTPEITNRPGGGSGGAQDVGGSTSGGSSSGSTAPWQTFNLTSYNALCPPVTINGRSFQGCTGITATGLDVRNGNLDHRVVAVDKKQIPLHSIVEIEGMGLFNAFDTGGDITNNRIDVLATSYAEAMKFGKQTKRVRVIRSGKGNGSRVPAVPKGQMPSWNGTTGSSGFSSPHANVDGAKANPTGFKKVISRPGGPQDVGKEVAGTVEAAKPVTYPMGGLVYTIPAYSSAFKKTLSANPSGVDGNLLCAIISATSDWREKHETSKQIGLTGLNKDYVNAILVGQNVLEGGNSIEFAADFIANALERFNGKVSFALAAFYEGNLTYVEEVTEKAGVMDFSKLRDKFGSAVSFVDKVIDIYTDLKDGTYIKGDPHKDFGSVSKKPTGNQTVDDEEYQNAPSTGNDVPEYEDAVKPKLSEEEKMFKMNLKRVEQGLIRNDSPAIEGNVLTADKLIYQFAKYTMQLHRARTHNINVSLSTCLPFLRPGLNAWLEPTRTDVVFYITGLTHQGSFQAGCTTNINGGFVRTSDNYQDVDTSIFVGETRATSETFGEIVNKSDMKALRSELNSMQSQDNVGSADSFSVLKKMYSSMNGTSEFATVWNKEMTFKEVDTEIAKHFSGAPSVVVKRKTEVASVIKKSEDIFLEKLLTIKV